MFTSLSLFSETLREAMRRVGHIFIIISIIMTGFAVAFHLAFGFAVKVHELFLFCEHGCHRRRKLYLFFFVFF